MDVLTDTLDTLRFNGSFYFRTELTSPWSIRIPEKPGVVRFHIVTRGQGWVSVDNKTQPLSMANGDLVVVPHGAAHTILDDPGTSERPLDDVLNEIEYPGDGPLIYGGDGPGTYLVCGEFSFSDAGNHPLLAHLPSMLHIAATEGLNRTWLDSALRFIAHEAIAGEEGSLAIVNRLSEIIFIQVIRAFSNAEDGRIPFLAALSDPQISDALSQIHLQPASDWTIERLGRAVGMSRSSFSNRFSDLVGMTPHSYLTLVRLQRAAKQLIKTEYAIATIVRNVGYRSEPAFSAAFKRQYGIRPGAYRKEHRTKERGITQ